MEHDSRAADGVHVSLVEVTRFLDGNARRVRDSDITVTSVSCAKGFGWGETYKAPSGRITLNSKSS